MFRGVAWRGAPPHLVSYFLSFFSLRFNTATLGFVVVGRHSRHRVEPAWFSFGWRMNKCIRMCVCISAHSISQLQPALPAFGPQRALSLCLPASERLVMAHVLALNALPVATRATKTRMRMRTRTPPTCAAPSSRDSDSPSTASLFVGTSSILAATQMSLPDIAMAAGRDDFGILAGRTVALVHPLVGE